MNRCASRRLRIAFGAASVVFAAAALCPLGAAAAEQPIEPGPAVESGPSTMRPLWELGIGVAAIHLPDYPGSDQSRSYLLPLPYIVYRGTFFKADRDGARALLFDSERVKVDLSVAASTPTRSNRNPAREGMPNLSGTLELGPNLNATVASSPAQRWKLDLRLPVRGAATLERSPKFVGVTFSPNLNLDVAGVGGSWNLGLLAGPVFADRTFYRYFYGVDPAYATAARPAYEAHGGYGGWRIVSATSRRIGNAWVGAFVRYDNLRGAAFEASPLVRRNAALSYGIGVSWILKTSSEMVPSGE
ncbi:MAG: MipA/OmpV family protein [Pseudomonadota bacterium]|nr:MipA/OmpV family protein [Pseudomonadota bacterium]